MMMNLFLKHASDPVCVKRALKVALIIGTILMVINHYDELINGTLTSTNIFQILVTYLVPFSVATYGSAMQARHLEIHGKLKEAD